MTEPVDATLPLRRGFVRLGGRPLVQHQLDMAIACGCERLICLVRALEPEVIALQRRAESAGMRFNTVAAPRELSALVTASDEVVVIYEGLLVEPSSAREVVEQGQGVFVQPVETGLAASFERIDINNASAGLLRIPGRLIEALVQMPPDCDIASSLARIALQAGVPAREVPAAARSGTRWQMIASESQAQAIEHEWLAERLGPARMSSPGRKLARMGILALGSSLLHAGNASLVMLASAIAGLALAVGTGWFAWSATSFLLAAIAWIALCSATSLRRLEAPLLAGEVKRDAGLLAVDWGFDAALILLIHWAAAPLAGIGPFPAVSLPVTLLLLVRICGKTPGMLLSVLIDDRAVLCLLLAVCAALGLVEWAVALGAVLMASAILFTLSARRG